MKSNMRRFFFALLVTILIGGSPLQGISTTGQAAAQTDKGGPKIGYNPETGRIAFIGGGTPIHVQNASGVRALSAQDKAMVVASQYGPEFGLKNPSRDLRLLNIRDDQNGHPIAHYQQIYQGVPVLAGQMIFNMNDNGDLLSVSGEVSPDLSLDTKPGISAGTASQIALGAIAKWYQMDLSFLTETEPELWIFDESLLKASTRTPELVWRVEVSSLNNAPIDEMVLVNAQTGNISLHFNQVDTLESPPEPEQSIRESVSAPAQGVTPTPEPSPTATPLPPAKGESGSSGQPPSNPSVGGAIWYVSSAGNNSYTCQTISAPCATINGALGKAAAGDTIKVAGGTYVFAGSGNPNVVTISKSITISGGWNNSFTSQTGYAAIDGENANNGVLVNSVSAVVVMDRFIIQNSKSNEGGGIYLYGSTFTLTNSTVQGNSATGRGAGIFGINSPHFTLINSTVSGNVAGTSGGGIYMDSGTTNIQYSTIAYNSASTGGGIAKNAGTLSMQDTILAHNTAATGPNCSFTIATSDHNIVGNITGCTIIAGTGDQLNVDPLIDTLSGMPPMHALQSDSPAIDAGDNSICPANDERGIPRPQNLTCDIGAYEYNVPGVPTTISISSGSPQNAVISTDFASLLVALVEDQYGSPSPGITVTFTAPASGASGTFSDTGTNTTSAVTDSSGLASASTFTANDATGSYTVDASASGIASPAQFQLENYIPTATTVTISSGSSQSTQVNTSFGSLLRALVKDQFDNPMSGVTATFTAPASGASGTFSDTGTNTTNIATDSSGIATASTFTANGTVGSYTVDATVSGVASPASFQLSNFMVGTWYVSPTGSDTNACNASGAPCLTINGAADKASAGDIVYIAAGTYTGTGSSVVTINKALTLSGGWNMNFSAQTGFSIVDGQNTRSGVRVPTPNNTTTIDRFIIQNGFQNDYGGGIQAFSALTLNNSLITNNRAGGGAGIFTSSDLVLNNTTVRNNMASSRGGGIEMYNLGSSLTINNSTIIDNQAGNSGGGILLDGGSSISAGTVTLQNSTIARNSAQGYYGGGIYMGGSSPSRTVIATNTILANNTASSSGPDCYGVISSSNHNIFGSISGCTVSAGAGNQLNTDPQISDYPIGALQYVPLLSASPAIDSGAACLPTDERGLSRPQGIACDIGAYENPATTGGAASSGISGGSNQHTPPGHAFAAPLAAYVVDAQGSPVSGVTVTFTAPVTGASGTFASNGSNTESVPTDSSGIAISSTFTANDQLGTYNVSAEVSGVASVDFVLANTAFYVAPVASGGNDSNSCTLPASPCLTINGAIGKGVQDGDFIYVASGTYAGSSGYVVTINKNITLSGGWDLSFASQNGFSIIDGQNTAGGISIDTTGPTTVSNFIIRNSNYGINHSGTDSTLNFDKGALINNNNGVRNTSGNVNLTNTTISGNHGSGMAGSAISNAGGTVSVQYSTITNNSGTSNYAIWNLNGSAHLEIGNSILAGNPYGDCTISANMTSGGHNIFGRAPACNGSGFTPAATDQVGVDPKLLMLFSESYHPLMVDSPAVDAAGTSCPATDQRGIARPQGTACDIGAFEYNGPGTTPGFIYAYSGTPQNVKINQVIGTNLTALVLDASGLGVPGVTVTFTAPASGASGTFSNDTNTTTAVTNTDGLATASAFTANSVYGTYSVQATVNGLSSPAEFSIKNLPSVDISVYTMNHSSDTNSLPGQFVCDISQTSCTSGSDPDVNYATLYALDTYLFYKDHFQRDGIDDAGLPIVSSVHFGNSYQNAYWDGSQMVYGDGYSQAEDVVAHELTHGVTDYTSQLLYLFQSGAINQLMSDIFGEFVQQENQPGGDPDWLVGEDLPGGAIRSMSNPPAYSDPDKISSPYFYTGNIAQDNGGVHTNSGVGNKATYLMVNGGSFNGKTITSIGMNKTAAIYYEAQTNLLGAGANYVDLYYALQQACLNLTGGDEGITPGDCDQVQNALDAVEMNVKPPQTFTPNPDACTASTAETDVFSDDMEQGTSNWQFYNGAGLESPGISSPTHALFVPEYSSIAQSYAAMSYDVILPGGAFLYFKHFFDLEGKL